MTNDNEKLVERLVGAWRKYVALFGEPPRGTRKQIAALLELNGVKGILDEALAAMREDAILECKKLCVAGRRSGCLCGLCLAAYQIGALRPDLDATLERIRDEARLECPFCGHEWSRHDPEDGRCDAGPPCKCGRDLEWMQSVIARLSRAALRQKVGK